MEGRGRGYREREERSKGKGREGIEIMKGREGTGNTEIGRRKTRRKRGIKGREGETKVKG